MTAAQPVVGYVVSDALYGLAFPVVGFGEPWNGWATPSFTVETGRAIVAAIAERDGKATAREAVSLDGVPLALVAFEDEAVTDALVAHVATLTLGEAYADMLDDEGREVEAYALDSLGRASWTWWTLGADEEVVEWEMDPSGLAVRVTFDPVRREARRTVEGGGYVMAVPVDPASPASMRSTLDLMGAPADVLDRVGSL